MSEQHDPTELGGTPAPPSSDGLAVGDPWITADDVAAYHDWPGAPDQRLVDATAAVKSAVERRRSDLDFSDGALVAADVRLGGVRWAGLIYQARGAPSGFTGYDEQSTIYDSLGSQRGEILRLIGWRRPVAL